jgi:hypothetical protein
MASLAWSLVSPLEASREHEDFAGQWPRLVGHALLGQVEAHVAQVADGLPAPLIVEEPRHRLGDLGPDARDLIDLFGAGILETVHGPEACGEELGRALPDHADARPLSTRESPRPLRRLDGRHQIGRRLLRETVQPRDLLDAELIEVAHVSHQLTIHELLDDNLPRCSMSMARREPQWKSRSLSWAGQATLVQRQIASPSGRSAGAPQAGHWWGIAKGGASGGRLAVTTCTRYGMTSPRALDEHDVARSARPSA